MKRLDTKKTVSHHTTPSQGIPLFRSLAWHTGISALAERGKDIRMMTIIRYDANIANNLIQGTVRAPENQKGIEELRESSRVHADPFDHIDVRKRHQYDNITHLCAFAIGDWCKCLCSSFQKPDTLVNATDRLKNSTSKSLAFKNAITRYNASSATESLPEFSESALLKTFGTPTGSKWILYSVTQLIVDKNNINNNVQGKYLTVDTLDTFTIKSRLYDKYHVSNTTRGSGICILHNYDAPTTTTTTATKTTKKKPAKRAKGKSAKGKGALDVKSSTDDDGNNEDNDDEEKQTIAAHDTDENNDTGHNEKDAADDEEDVDEYEDNASDRKDDANEDAEDNDTSCTENKSTMHKPPLKRRLLDDDR